MPTQRPFLSNFLAAFRAHQQQLPKAAPSIGASTAVAGGAQTLWTTAAQQPQKQAAPTSETTFASPRPINPKQSAYGQTTAAATAAVVDKQFATSLPPLQHNVSPATHLPRSPPSPGLPVYGPQNKPQPTYPTVQESRRARRGSDSSDGSSGFREVRGGGAAGGEKWWIGGRNGSGEEKYYKLSMARRDRSSDRLSADQMSL